MKFLNNYYSFSDNVLRAPANWLPLEESAESTDFIGDWSNVRTSPMSSSLDLILERASN
jgi:hypothetical protein